MKSERVSIGYHLQFESAFHFGTGLRSGIVHRLVARDPDGYVYVPGSTLKGVLRERCEQLASLFDIPVIRPHQEDWHEANGSDVDLVARIFGTRFVPGQLYFDDAQLIQSQRDWFKPPHQDPKMQRAYKSSYRDWQTERRTQVSMSRATRTAEQEHLYTSEYGRSDLLFQGQIAGRLEGTPLFYNDDCGTFPLLMLVVSMLSLDHIGGSNSTGAGRITCEIDAISVDDQECPLEQLLDDLPALELYDELRKGARA